jgi:hypothetical protein
LNAKIISPRVFTIFVVMALVTTFATTPLTHALYPPWYQKKLESWKRGEIDWDGNRLTPENRDHDATLQMDLQKATSVKKLLVFLRLDSLSSMFTLINLLTGDNSNAAVVKVHPSKGTESVSDNFNEKPLAVHGVRMVELSERTSNIMQISQLEDNVQDPVLNIFKTFGQINNVAVSGEVATVPVDSFSDEITTIASRNPSDMLLLPWSETGSISESDTPFLSTSNEGKFNSGPHAQFVINTLSTTRNAVGVFVNRGFGGPVRKDRKPGLHRTYSGVSIASHREAVATLPVLDRSHHIFLPYFATADDRAALRFVLQLALNSNVTATIVHVHYDGSPTSAPEISTEDKAPQATTNSPVDDDAFFTSMADSLPSKLADRVVFDTVRTSSPLQWVLERAGQEVSQSPRNAGDLIVLGRRIEATRSVGSSSMSLPVNAQGERDIAKALGEVGETLVEGRVRASVLVIQAAQR